MAKQEKARIEARIDSLEDILSRAVILEEGSGEVIGLGSVVELEDPLSGERLSVQVVSPAEANVLDTPMKISDASPMGKALWATGWGTCSPWTPPRAGGSSGWWPSTVEAMNDQTRQRLLNLEALVEAGFAPYPYRFPKTHSAEAILKAKRGAPLSPSGRRRRWPWPGASWP